MAMILISNFFGGPASQVSIVGHGNSLLTALGGLRTSCPSRPIIFVVHSLGGLVLKEALRQSWQAQAYEDRRAVYNSTIAVIFMGTPHRGSDYADWGIILRNIAVASGFDASDRNLGDLRGDSPMLEILRSDFGKMLKEERFELYTFQEGKGLKGVRGLTGKVRLMMSLNRSRADTPSRLYRMCRQDLMMLVSGKISSMQIIWKCVASRVQRMLGIGRLKMFFPDVWAVFNLVLRSSMAPYLWVRHP